MTDGQTDSATRAAALLRAARGKPEARLAALPEALRPADAAAAYRVQARASEGVAIGGWKVGAAAPGKPPFCAPMPAAGIKASPATLGAGVFRGLSGRPTPRDKAHPGHSPSADGRITAGSVRLGSQEDRGVSRLQS